MIMLINEVLKVMTPVVESIPLKLIETLERRGYTVLGGGVDAVAFLEPRSGLVLKVIGSNEYHKTDPVGHVSKKQKIFMDYYEYMRKHPNNPYLPQVYNVRIKRYWNKNLLFIRMERLFELYHDLINQPKYRGWAWILSDIAHDIRRGFNQKQVMMSIVNRAESEPTLGVTKKQYDQDDLNSLFVHIGQDGWDTLYHTVRDLADIAIDNDYLLDLNPRNWLFGSDGQIVISDPFHAFTGTSMRDRAAR